MLKLYWEKHNKFGLTVYEANFTANEEQTAIAFAASLKAQPGVQGVVLHDFRPGKTRKRVDVLEPWSNLNDPALWTATKIGTALVTAPACEVINTDRKPPARKPRKPVLATVEAFDPPSLPGKPRITKRQRAFGVACTA